LANFGSICCRAPIGICPDVTARSNRANIFYSTRSQAPTACKRFADKEVSDRPQKKGKRKQGISAHSIVLFSPLNKWISSDTGLKWRKMSLLGSISNYIVKNGLPPQIFVLRPSPCCQFSRR
jgi:hypothetical protein